MQENHKLVTSVRVTPYEMGRAKILAEKLRMKMTDYFNQALTKHNNDLSSLLLVQEFKKREAK